MDHLSDHRPVFVSSEDYAQFKADHPFVFDVDAHSRQIKELFFIDNNQYIGQNKEEVYALDAFKAYAERKAGDVVYAYFPWNHHVIKTVPKSGYLRLKTNRNQDLITAQEQSVLSQFKVAVFGMSVGSNIAFVLTQAGISNHVTLADFDELDTTNLNRILAGAHQIGVNKAIVAARRIYEDNPFAEVTVWTHGADIQTLEKALQEGSIQCIVEEVDEMNFKIQARMLAMKYKVPVVMVTDNGDGVVLHIERYDLGHTKIWGRDVEYFEKKLADGPMTKEKAGQIIMFDIVGGPDKVDPKMLASVQRVLKRELVSWSQLGSAAILGGVMATYAVKKIALGEDARLDVRSYVFPDAITHSNHSQS